MRVLELGDCSLINRTIDLKLCCFYKTQHFPASFLRVLGKVEVPLGELLSNKEIERTYDLVDGKNNPTLVRKVTVLENNCLLNLNKLNK